MFIFKFNQWLEAVDPYAILRITFYKSLFVATVVTYVYWIFRPASFMAFVSPFFLVSMYEVPAIATIKAKERLLIYITITIILLSVSFYLVYPFKVTFFFFSTAVLAALYFSVLKYFYILKNLTMLIIATAAVLLSTEPRANLLIAYDFASATTLAMITVFICLKIFPNVYLLSWNKALQKFIEYFEKDIENAIHQLHQSPIQEEVLHYQMVRNFQNIVPKKYLMQTFRITVNLRNIQHALDNLYYEEKNELFWQGIKNNLHTLRMNMGEYIPCSMLFVTPQTKLQRYTVDCLEQIFIHWNKLCAIRNS